MPKNAPDLRFGLGNSQGFTSVGVATFDNLRPAAVVRELIQNGLDAARNAGVRPAIVRFRLTEIQRASIPGIRTYETAFEKAVETQQSQSGGSLAEPAKLVVRRIRDALSKEHVKVLTVLDNGVGLDEQRMNALLSDGVSMKESTATGTYGNGHHTAIPASDLRYVLYGGITGSGERIGAGHAVLASYKEERDRQPHSGDGFYIRDFRKGRGSLYSYATGSGLPDLIANAVEEVKDKTKRGSAIIIPGFNNFLEDEPLSEMVLRAASASFFPAIAAGDLHVIVEDHEVGNDGDWRLLDKETLLEVLNSHRGNRRGGTFLSGQRAFEAHDTYVRGTKHTISTSAGSIEIHLLENAASISRVDLCRNGMWITDKVPGFQQKFTDKVPFHAVLSLSAEKGGELHELVRVAEGPLHDTIVMKHLPVPERRTCYTALREVVEWIRSHTTTVDSSAYTTPDFLALNFGDEEGSRAQRGNRRFWGVPVAITHPPPRQMQFFTTERQGDGQPGPSGRRPDQPSSRRRGRVRPSLPAVFQAVSRPTGQNRRQIVIECARPYADAELRLVVDEALDATCDRHGQDEYAPAVLENITINGKPVEETKLVRWNDEVIGVRLGNLKPDSAVEIETAYRLAGDFAELPDPSLRVEVFKTERQPEQDS